MANAKKPVRTVKKTATPVAPTKKTPPVKPTAAPVKKTSATPAPAAPENAATATMQRRKYKSDLADLVGGPARYYFACSGCGTNLTEFAESQQTPMRVETIMYCPNCQKPFVAAQQARCYCCASTLADDGSCLNCGAKRSDSDDMKVAVIYMRIAMNMAHGTRMTRTQAATMVIPDAVLMAQIKAQAANEHWIERAEEMAPGTSGSTGNSQSGTIRLSGIRETF